MVTKIIFLLVFFTSMIAVGLYSRKHATNVNDFVLGGRAVGPWLTAFAYGTSYFSAVVFVGYAGQFGYKYGLASTWIGIGNAIIGSLLAWVILGRRTRVMTKHLSASTMPDYFGKRYDSNALRIAASVISFIFLIPYTASVYNGLSRLFGMAFDIPYAVCVIAMAALTGVYVVLGGYMATAINDFIQGIIMLFGIVAVIVAVLNGQGGFYNAVIELSKLESDVPLTMGQQGVFASFFGPDLPNLIGVVILTSLGTWGLPQMVHKFYAIKDEKSIKSGTIISTFFAIIVSGGCYFLGGFARLFDTPAIHAEDGSVIYDAIVPSMLSTLPDILVGIVIVLVLSASMSTLSSLVLTSSSTLTLDFIKGNIVARSKPKFVDYMLYLNDGKPIAVVEAKDNNHSVSHGLQQAMTYAQMLDLPFAYSSNGDAFFEHDFLTGKERQIDLDKFPTQDELIARYYRELNGGTGITEKEKKIVEQPYYSSQSTYPPRDYQRNAVNRTVEAIAKGQDRLLL